MEELHIIKYLIFKWLKIRYYIFFYNHDIEQDSSIGSSLSNLSVSHKLETCWGCYNFYLKWEELLYRQQKYVAIVQILNIFFLYRVNVLLVWLK